ncbi:MAG TPA: guanosine monophosphate reductase [Candidatus Dormibacteraeota bacterium]|jgi:IMP dehydrogenase|nr:guanosine monophosphate reductase [Candidatus Dormibacteraeota bacterium]
MAAVAIITTPRTPPGTALDEAPQAFDFDHLSLVPRVASSLRHRADADTSVAVGPLTITLPLIASPMPDVCGPHMCRSLSAAGALGVLHRFQPIEDQVKQLAESGTVAAAIGVTGDYRERWQALHAAGCQIVCLDTANGAHDQVAKAMAWIRSQAEDVFLVAGNVASGDAFSWLEDRGADAVRVGIAGGSVCETRTETGVYVPTPYAVYEAAQVRRSALIIGDGGVRTPADLCKLLAIGADAVMVGSVLAGTDEAPGRLVMVDGKLHKIMRGAASFSVQQEAGNEDPQYVEGAETLVQAKGPVDGVLRRFLGGLRSSMSYLDSRTLSEYRANATFVRLY